MSMGIKEGSTIATARGNAVVTKIGKPHLSGRNGTTWVMLTLRIGESEAYCAARADELA